MTQTAQKYYPSSACFFFCPFFLLVLHRLFLFHLFPVKNKKRNSAVALFPLRQRRRYGKSSKMVRISVLNDTLKVSDARDNGA